MIELLITIVFAIILLTIGSLSICLGVYVFQLVFMKFIRDTLPTIAEAWGRYKYPEKFID